ncbi:hypothetical protein M408DRAFT_93228 [Serendipita vermifera MAFF 305830]|uniref:Uncharacterized protein n=1 Tax=Serendipita vermifera MAFF 305830 TaxID=933852 RepID=A0A0C3BBS5_SERVB|nr:hypothetical protein M408DRAFT_93228 [Serendipita vermifera MAFF 305830]
MLRISRLLHASPISRRSLAKFTPDAFSHSIGRRNLHFTESEYGSQPGREPTQEELFDAYSETINLNASSQTVPITAELAVVLPRAHELGASHVLRDIASRYLLSSERDDALGHALLESDRSMSLLSRSQAVAIFKRLVDHEHNLEYLSTNVLIYMGHVCIIDSASNLFAMEAILFTLLERWSQHQGIGHEHHYHGTWAIFQLLREIMKIAPENGQRQFTAMLQSKPWWPEGSTVIDQAIKDPAIIASMFMLRCCMAWRWWERGYAVAHELIQALANDATVALPMHATLASLIKAHIDSAGLLIEPSLCAALICAMADEPSLPPLSNTVLQQFYKSCAESKPPKPETANAVYLYLREKQFSTLSPNATASEGLSPKVPHSYQPPTGRRILTLLDLYHRTNDHNSARLLVSDVQKRLDTIPTDILVSYLIFLIKLSFATEARAVYSMCLASTDPDKGSSALSKICAPTREMGTPTPHHLGAHLLHHRGS